VSEGDAQGRSRKRSPKAAILAAASQAWGEQGLASGAWLLRGVGLLVTSGLGRISQSLAAARGKWQAGVELSRTRCCARRRPHGWDSKQLERVLAVATGLGPRPVFVGDFDQLHAAPAESPFQDLMRNIPDQRGGAS